MAEQEKAIARAFHEAYERLAPDFGYRTREASAKPWAEVPEQNRKLMEATVANLIDRGVVRYCLLSPAEVEEAVAELDSRRIRPSLALTNPQKELDYLAGLRADVRAAANAFGLSLQGPENG